VVSAGHFNLVIARSASDEAIHVSARCGMDCFAPLAMTITAGLALPRMAENGGKLRAFAFAKFIPVHLAGVEMIEWYFRVMAQRAGGKAPLQFAQHVPRHRMQIRERF
jgi:hypothetical protein